MAKKKTTDQTEQEVIVDDTPEVLETVAKKGPSAKAKRAAKEAKAAAKAEVEGAETAEVNTEAGEGAEVAEAEAEAPKKAARSARSRSHRYQAVRSQVDKTKTYDAFAAVELVKKLSYSKFPGTVVANCLVKEENTQVTMKFPHSTGKSLTVAVVSDDVLKQIEAGQINFDILITEPRYMPQLAKFARVLGPKGLMPNPKNGTVTANPELKKQELEGGKITLKGEKKAPLMHVSLGKTSTDTKALVENLQALEAALRGKLLKMSISATMSPSVKVTIA